MVHRPWTSAHTSLRMLAVALALLLSIGGDARAGLDSFSYRLNGGAGGVAGEGASGAGVDTNTGAAQTGVTFDLPAARGAAQPTLSLAYSSRAGDGEAGLGWQLAHPSIARKRSSDGYVQMPSSDGTVPFSFPKLAYPSPTPTMSGIPTPGAPLSPTHADRFEWNGRPLVLVCASVAAGCSGGEAFSPGVMNTAYYALQSESGAFVRLFLHNAASGGSHWTVEHKSGVVETYGDPSGDSLNVATERAPAATGAGIPVRWRLSSASDPNGNGVFYEWRRNPRGNDGEPVLGGRGLSYLNDIYYSAALGTPGADLSFQAGHAYAYHVALVWERPDFRQQSYAPVWSARPDLRLKRVDVAAKTWLAEGARQQVRRYHFGYYPHADSGEYAPGIHAPLNGHSFLKSVEVEGASGDEEADERLPTDGQGARLRPRIFHYAPRATLFGSHPATVHRRFDPQPGDPQPPVLTGLRRTTILDVNRDGWPDVVQDHSRLFRNATGKFDVASTFVADCLSGPPAAGLDPMWLNVLSPEGFTIPGAWGHHDQGPSLLWRDSVSRFGLGGDSRTRPGHTWWLANVRESSTACASDHPEHARRSWTLDRIPLSTSLSPGAPAGKDADGVFDVGDVDGDGLPDAYVRTEEATGHSAVIRFSRQHRGASPQDIAKLSERVATNLRLEGYACDPGNLDSCRYEREGADPVPEADAKFDHRVHVLIDMNGDGLADAVGSSRMTPVTSYEWKNDFRLGYFPGDGRGRFGCDASRHFQPPLSEPNLTGCTASLGAKYGVDGDSNGVAITLQNRVQADFPSGTQPLFRDINGDGFTDIVAPRLELTAAEPPAYRLRFAIWLNEDGFRFRRYCEGDPTGATCQGSSGADPTSENYVVGTDPVVYPLNLTAPTGFNSFRFAFGDLDANGIDEILVLEADGVTSIQLRSDTGTKPGLLTSIENGHGGSTSYAYESYQRHIRDEVDDTPDNQLEAVTQVVTNVTTSNNLPGLPARVHSLTYRYRKPAFDSWRRALVGFGEVIVNESGHATQRSRYLYGPCQSASGCAATSEVDPEAIQGGLPVTVETLDSDPTLQFASPKAIRVVRYEYEGQPLPTLDRPRYYTRLKSARTYLLDNTTPTAVDTQVTVLTYPGASQQPVPVVKTITEWSAAESEVVYQEYDHDAFGNTTETRDFGRVQANLTPIDPVIVHRATPTQIGTLWAFRTTYARVTQTGAPTPSPDREVLYAYDGKGNLESVSANLTGVQLLDRAHALPGAVTAPQPTTAAVNGLVLLKYYKVDPQSGQVVLEAGPFVNGEGPCAEVVYDPAYGSFPTEVKTGKSYALGAPGCSNALGSNRYASVRTVYDRKLGVPTERVGAHLDLTRWVYDGFGRIIEARDPSPTSPLTTEPAPRIALDYKDFATYARVTVLGRDGSEAHAYTDGLGTPLMTLTRSKSGADPGWIASGVAQWTGRGEVSRSYVPFAYAGSIGSPNFSAPSGLGAAFEYWYDGLGRAVLTTDGFVAGATTVVSEVEYGPLSVKYKDAEQANPASSHAGAFAQDLFDGHGRVRAQRRQASADTVTVAFERQATGEVVRETHSHLGGPETFERTFQYDSLGRMVRQVEPNTHRLRTWRYAYDAAGRLVGTSDARGCGNNFHYDVVGRLIARDASPCLASQPEYTPPDLATGHGTEAFNIYDNEALGDPASIVGTNLGRLVATQDSGAHTRFAYDWKGRQTALSRRVVVPGEPTADLGTRYAPHWFRTEATYDSVDRVAAQSTGADHPDLLDPAGQSKLTLAYDVRGALAAVGSTYGTLVSSIAYRPDGTPSTVQLDDAGRTKVDYEYKNDARALIEKVKAGRTETPAIWGAPGYVSTAVELAQQQQFIDTHFTRDDVGNRTSTVDGLEVGVWPPGTKPVNVAAAYDDNYRLTGIAYTGEDSSRRAPFVHEGPRAVPRLQRSRMTSQAFAYDWRGNIVGSASDDGTAHYDRLLGATERTSSAVWPTVGPDRLVRSVADGNEVVRAAYDDAGNMIDLVVRRPGECQGPRCNQRYVYDWDESGQLRRARRWDYTEAELVSAPTYPAEPTGAPAYDLQYAYSASQRVLKTSRDSAGVDAHTLEVFPSLRVERTTFTDGDYVRSAENEHVYLGSLGRVWMGTALTPGGAAGPVRLALRLGDALGSTSVTIDHRTSEVMEKVWYDANGNTESDYRPSQWNKYREDYRFTGKEEDIEVGLVYFGARYLNTNLRQWISPDPLTIHGGGGDSNPYAYVRGRVLNAVDPWGLDDRASMNAWDWLSGKIADGIAAIGNAIGGLFSGGGPAGPSAGGAPPTVPPPVPPPEEQGVSVFGSMFPSYATGTLRPLSVGAQGPNHWGGVRQTAIGTGEEGLAGSAHLYLAASGSASLATSLSLVLPAAAESGGAAGLELGVQAGARVPQLVSLSTGVTSAAAAVNGNSLGGAGGAAEGAAGGGGQSVARVLLHDTGHASIVTEVGGQALHTHQVQIMGGRLTTIAEGASGAPVINSATVPLPNGSLAQAFQRGVIGKPGGAYNIVRNNCFRHCADVLRAGGVEGVPADSRQLVPWLFGDGIRF